MTQNQRRHERVLAPGVTVRVEFESSEELERCLLHDISRGGVFLCAESVQPLGSVVTLALSLSGMEILKLRGRVVHVRPGGGAVLRGMGVEFTDLSDAVLARLEGYIEGLKARQQADAVAEESPPIRAATG